jgi:hypothetical protein
LTYWLDSEFIIQLATHRDSFALNHNIWHLIPFHVFISSSHVIFLIWSILIPTNKCSKQELYMNKLLNYRIVELFCWWMGMETGDWRLEIGKHMKE